MFDSLFHVQKIPGDLIFVRKETNEIMFVIFDYEMAEEFGYEAESTFDGDKYLSYTGITLNDLKDNVVFEDANLIVYHVEY